MGSRYPKTNRMRLFPNKNPDGWTAYIWLIYLLYFALVPFLSGATVMDRVLALAATAVALPLYFLGYWLPDRRVLWVVAGFLVLGTLFARSNQAAAVFVVYAACYLGQVGEPRVAFRYLAGLLALVGVESWVWNFPREYWVAGEVFGALMGSVTIHSWQRGRLNQKLASAQEQAEHMAKVAERERIARDLHDLLGHTLSVIVLKSELASRLTASDPARAVAEIRDVERISRDALAQVRDAVRGYRSTGLTGEWAEARRALETAGIRVEASLVPLQLSAAQESVFSLALREAVTNVLRHARATVCRLSLKRDGEYCELEIADNGRGGPLKEGSGLSGMRERVEALGGVLERDGTAGTLLRIRVPV